MVSRFAAHITRLRSSVVLIAWNHVHGIAQGLLLPEERQNVKSPKAARVASGKVSPKHRSPHRLVAEAHWK